MFFLPSSFRGGTTIRSGEREREREREREGGRERRETERIAIVCVFYVRLPFKGIRFRQSCVSGRTDGHASKPNWWRWTRTSLAFRKPPPKRTYVSDWCMWHHHSHVRTWVTDTCDTTTQTYAREWLMYVTPPLKRTYVSDWYMWHRHSNVRTRDRFFRKLEIWGRNQKSKLYFRHFFSAKIFEKKKSLMFEKSIFFSKRRSEWLIYVKPPLKRTYVSDWIGVMLLRGVCRCIF